MSYRGTHPKTTIIKALIKQKGGDWNPSTQAVATDDGLRLLEALVADLGVAACRAALDKQGFESVAYDYLLQPLCEEARRRRLAADQWHALQRQQASASANGNPIGDGPPS